MHDDAPDARGKWDARYAAVDAAAEAPVALALRENAHLLPNAPADALDLACGLGGSALFLAALGHRVVAWDVSPAAIERVVAEAGQRRLAVRAQVRDVERDPPLPESCDVIVVRHFLAREIAGDIARALRPGGLLFYETFTRATPSDGGPRNPAYRLAEGELLALFSQLKPRVYREEGLLGDLRRGFRGEALLVAQKA